MKNMKRPASVTVKMFSHHHLAMAITLLAVLLSTRFGGFFSLPPGNISAFWPANALLFSGVFLLPPRQGRMTLLLALLAYAGAELWIGYPLHNAIIYGFANVIEVTVLLWLLRRTEVRSLAFDRLRDLFLLFAFALLASSVGGAIGAIEASREGGAFWTVFLRWSLADFFGYCLCVPLVLTWRQWRQTFAFESPARIMESAALLMVLVLVSVISSGIHFLGLSAPLGAQFLPLPLLLWAALRFGPPGGAIATVIVASAAFFSATHGVGLFGAGAPEENVASLQLFFAALVISVMTIASLNAERKKSFDAMQQEVAERKQAEQALQKSETLLNATQRLSKVGGWEFDVKSDKFFWTDELYRIHEIPNDPGIDHIKESLACYRAEDRQIIYEAFRRACEQGESYDLEFPFTTYTGKPLWIRTTAQPVYEEGKVVRIVGNLMDITGHKQAEEEIRRLNRELEQRVAERTAQLETAIYDLENFNYSASHDLRIPLRAIDGFSRILLDEYSQLLGPEGTRLLHVVRASTRKMAQYIEDMLAFTTIGRMAVQPAEVNMDALAHEVAEELGTAATGRELEFRIDKLPSVIADKAMMRWVMVNLLANAIKFTRSKEAAQIEVGAKTEDKETVFFVKDNGVGFNMQHADKLFGVFQRLHSVEEFEGTGIGLAIVKRVVTKLGGRVWAEGKVNEGATVYFALPGNPAGQVKEP